MDLRQLEYFVAVAEEASFTKAAAKLHVAQPGVSAQVRRLEAELGQTLLDRSGRTVGLTDVGRTVMPFARAALSAVAGVRHAVDELVGLLRGRISVGMIPSCSVFDLPEVLANFHGLYPAVDITLSEANTDDLVSGVRDGLLDVALIGLGVARPTDLGLLPIAAELLVAAVRRDGPLGGADSISMIDLSIHPLIALPRGTGLRSVIDAGFASLGLRPHVAFEASDPHVLTQLAARGLGVAIVPRAIATARAEVAAIPISGAELTGGVAFVWRPDGSSGPAAQALIEHARQAIADRTG